MNTVQVRNDPEPRNNLAVKQSSDAHCKRKHPSVALTVKG